jgi:ketosteroid isomerase-like protein
MATENITERSAEQVVRDYFGALGHHDVAAAAEYMSPDVVEEITGVGVLRGPGEVREFFGGLMKAVPDLDFVVDRVVADGDFAVVQWRINGTFDGGPLFNGVQATGGQVNFRGCDVIEVRDGLIVRNTAYQDGMEMARSLGMMPPQDSAAERAMIAAFNGMTKVRRAVRDRVGG